MSTTTGSAAPTSALAPPPISAAAAGPRAMPDGPASAGVARTRGAILGLSLAMLLPSLDTSIANVALPTLARRFAAPFHEVQWVVLAYLLAVTTSIVGVGRLGDLVGRRRLLLTGIGVFAAASIACGVAPTLGLLIAARAAQGVAAAALMALTMAVVRAAVPTARIGRAIGVLGTMSAVGTALGPTLGGGLIEMFGWRAIFLINVPLGALTWFLARRFVPVEPPSPARARPSFDLVGTALLAATLGAYALAMTAGRDGFAAPQIALLAIAAAGAIAFVSVEARVSSPLIAPSLLREPMLAAGVVLSALVTTVVMASLVIGPFHLAGALGLAPALVGLAMSCGPLTAALTGIPAGRLVDRIGSNRTMLAGLVAMATGCAAIAVLPATLGVAGYLMPLVIVTAGYALFQAANTTAVMTASAAEQRGVVAGVLALARNIGLITGAAVMGAVFAHAAAAPDGRAADAWRVARGTRTTFACAAGLMLLAIGIAACAGRAGAAAARRRDAGR